MNIVFYLASAIALVSAVMVITRTVAVHALLYMIVTLLALAVSFFTLGAPFIAAIEVIIYAGAIMVLFVFVIMILNLGTQTSQQEREWLKPQTWAGPAILAAILVIELIYIFATGGPNSLQGSAIEPKQVSLALFGPYLLVVELASILLMASIIGAYHLGRRDTL